MRRVAESRAGRGVACSVLHHRHPLVSDDGSSRPDHALAFDISDESAAELERWAGVAISTAVMAYGLSRRSVPGVVLAAAAAPLAYRSLTGEWPGDEYRALRSAPS